MHLCVPDHEDERGVGVFGAIEEIFTLDVAVDDPRLLVGCDATRALIRNLSRFLKLKKKKRAKKKFSLSLSLEV